MTDYELPHDVQADLEALVQAVLPFAEQMLRKGGSFEPFAATMSADGSVALAMAEGEEAQEQKALLLRGFRSRAAELRATALCMNVRVQTPGGEATNAARVMLEHAAGHAVDLFRPYRKRFLRTPVFGETFSTRGERLVFTEPAA